MLEATGPGFDEASEFCLSKFCAKMLSLKFTHQPREWPAGGYLDNKIERVMKRLLDSPPTYFLYSAIWNRSDSPKQQVNLPVLDNFGRRRHLEFTPSKLLES